jgi:hypothetical protein
MNYRVICNQTIILSEQNRKIHSEECLEMVDGLSEPGQSLDFYEATRKTNKKKAKKDVILGKMGEILSKNYLMKEFNLPEIEIDFSIKDKKNKGWEHDIPYSKISENLPNFHVKTCSKSTLKYCPAKQPSWMFQKSDKMVFKKTDEETKNDYCVFVYMDNENSTEGKIMAILPINEVKQKCREPGVHQLRNSKTTLYFADYVNELPEELEEAIS